MRPRADEAIRSLHPMTDAKLTIGGIAVRKWLCILLAACVALSLSACRGRDDAQPQADEPAPDPTVYMAQPIEPDPEPEPEPTPEPEIVELLPPSSFVMETNTNRTLWVSYQYPSHWETVYGRHTLCYVEPTTEGTEPARMAIACRAQLSYPSDAEMEKQMTSVLDKIEERSDSLTRGEYKYGVGMMGTKGFRQTYVAQVNGQEITGYLIMAYVNNKIYLLHMSAPTDRYEALSDVWYNIRMGLVSLT